MVMTFGASHFGSQRNLMLLETVPVDLNQFGDLERCLLRSGNAHSADDWRLVLEPIVARHRDPGIDLNFQADAAFAKAPGPTSCWSAKASAARSAWRPTRCCQGRIGHC